MILDEIKKDYILDLVQKGQRADGRGLLDYRPIHLEKNVIPNAEGSALAYLGNTKVLCGVKVDVATPFADRPNEGVIICNSEFSPIAHPDFYPGPPDERSIELARVVDRGIRSAEAIDVKKLVLEEGKVMGVFVDLYIIDHDGNLIDAATLAAAAALSVARVPKYENGKFIRDQIAGKLAVEKTVVSCSFEKIANQPVLDANNQEEIASLGRMTLSTCDGNLICAGQKSGKAGFTRDEFSHLIDLALEKRNVLLDVLKE